MGLELAYRVQAAFLPLALDVYVSATCVLRGDDDGAAADGDDDGADDGGDADDDGDNDGDDNNDDDADKL